MNQERRGFLGALLSFLGFGAASAIGAAPTLTPKLKGFLVFTVNVGGMPPYKAEAFLERLKERMVKQRHDPDWQIVMLPVRPPQESKFEVIVVDGDETTGKIEARRVKAFEMMQEQQEEEKGTQEFPTLCQTTDYILLQLGAPVVKVELDQQQISLCYDKAVEEIENSPYVERPSTVMDGALAYAKTILGRVRSKYHNDASPMDGPSLMAEGERDLLRWREKIGIA